MTTLNMNRTQSIHPNGREAASFGSGTKPARTRDGQKYPGGKTLRRRLANLQRRKEGEQGPGHHTPDCHRGGQQNWATVPGSMNG